MSNKVYWAGVEYLYSPRSPEFKKLKGGFVYAFVSSKNKNLALDKIKQELENILLIPADIEFIELYHIKTRWKTIEETKRYICLFNESQKCDRVLFDIFYAYEND